MSYFKTGQEWLDQSALLIQASPTTTKITTRYSIKAVKRRKPSASSATAELSSPDGRPPRATLVLKTFDPASGVTLRYRTTKAAEVSRLMGAAMGRLGRGMAALPDAPPPEESMPDAGEEAAAGEDKDKEQKDKEQKQSAPATGGGGKKKKKGKK